jgi:aminomethyltransferase
MTELKLTPLNNWHLTKGAKMVPFAGYNMPVQYPLGVLKEHQHTRSAVGLFDVSHMGQIQVLGENIAEVLETVFPANLVDLAVNTQCYSLLMNGEGGVLDDLMICRRELDFILVVNASCKDADFAYLQEKIGKQVDLIMLDDRALLALQGPKAAQVLSELGAEIDDMIFMDGAWLEIKGIECWATRSGYTGEDGFELSVANDKAEKLADILCQHSEVQAIGLGARDSLRLEAGLCLYGHELNPYTTPIEASLIWAIAKARRVNGERAGGFYGAEVILRQIAEGTDKKRIGLVSDGKAPVREHTKLFDEHNNEIGEVTSGGFSPTLSKPIAIAYVDSSALQLQHMFAEVRGKKLPMTVVKMPFVDTRYYRG